MAQMSKKLTDKNFDIIEKTVAFPNNIVVLCSSFAKFIAILFRKNTTQIINVFIFK